MSIIEMGGGAGGWRGRVLFGRVKFEMCEMTSWHVSLQSRK